MTRARLLMLLLGFAALVSAPRAGGAPVPKDEKADGVPELKVVFDVASAAVKDRKWPANADEAKLTDFAKNTFERTLKAAELKNRTLPFAAKQKQLKKVGPFPQKYTENAVRDSFVIAEEVEINGAYGCLIVATGKVTINGAVDCVVIGKNVTCTSTENCFVVADEMTFVGGARANEDKYHSVLVGGKWVRVGSATDTVCHVFRPGTDKCPLDKLSFPIFAGRADDTIFLNDEKQLMATTNKNGKTFVPKAPILK